MQIHQLPSASTLAVGDKFAVSQGGVTKSATLQNIQTPISSTPTFASTLTVPVDGVDFVYIALTGNLTSLQFTGGVQGQRIILNLVQDVTGSRTVALGSSFKFGTTITSFTATTTSSKSDMIDLVCIGSGAFRVMDVNKGF